MWVVHNTTMPAIKYDLKEKAIALRKKGNTYSEILQQIPIAKSTLSDWLHSVGLSKYQRQRLTEKKLLSAKHGGEAKHLQRIEKMAAIIKTAKAEVGPLSKRELWLMGVMLYWAEGSKEKEYRPGTGVLFTNMDPLMICFFIHWLETAFGVNKTDLIFEITIHETHRHRLKEIINYWSKIIGIPSQAFSHIYFKKASIKTNRKNINETYFGVIRIKVRSSTDLNRSIAGWTLGVVESSRNWGVV
jgi:hypothetical protein